MLALKPPLGSISLTVPTHETLLLSLSSSSIIRMLNRMRKDLFYRSLFVYRGAGSLEHQAYIIIWVGYFLAYGGIPLNEKDIPFTRMPYRLPLLDLFLCVWNNVG